MDELNYLDAVKDGQLHFADGSVQPIPHWEDRAWMQIFFARHAEKDKEEPHDPGLSAEGEARAERLGRIMATAGLDVVYSSPYKRAQLTAEPIQRRSHTPAVVLYQNDMLEQWLLDLLSSDAGKRIFVVGHQFTIPHLLNQLKGHGFDYDNIPDTDYGRLYIATTKGIGETEILEVRY